MPRIGLTYILLFFIILSFLSYADEQKISDITIKRTELIDGSNFKLKTGEKIEIIDLKNSSKFFPNNIFLTKNMRVKVNYISENSKLPEFELKSQKKTIEIEPLYKEEELLLQYAGLFLYPKKTHEKGVNILKIWIDDLNTFFELHEKDFSVIKTIQSFITTYINEPHDGYIIGDQLWDKSRKIIEWYEFYEYPYYYDLNGRILTIDDKSIIDLPATIPISKMHSQIKLYPIVIRNLEYKFESLNTQILEAENAIKVLPEISSARRILVTIKLLRIGESMWHNLRPK